MEKTSRNRCSDDALDHPVSPVAKNKMPKLRRRTNLTDGFWPFMSSLALHALCFGILSLPAFQMRTSNASQTPTVLWFSSFELPDDNAEFAEITQTASDIFGEPGTAETEPASQPAEQAVTGDPSPVSAPEPDTDPENNSAPGNNEPVIAGNKPSESTETVDEMVYPKAVTRQSAPTPSPVPQKKVIQSSIPLKSEPDIKSKIPTGTAEPAPPPIDSLQEETARTLNKIAEEKRLAAEQSYQEQIAREQEQRVNNEKLRQQQAAAAERARQEEMRREKLEQERAAQKEALFKQEMARLAMLREQEQRASSERLKQQQAIAAEKARLEEVRREKLEQERAAQKEALFKQEMARLAMLREQEQRASSERLKQQQAAAAEKARQEEVRREKLEQERAAQKEALLKQEMARRANVKPQPEISAAAGTIAETSVPKIRETENNSRIPLKNPDKPISLPLVKGDLKLLVTGAMPETTVTFKELALSRRNRPFSRKEAKNELKIIPRLVTIRENSREVVIEKTTPGVYTFTVSPVGGKTDADFSLVLYEGSSKKIIKVLGSHSLTTKKVLVKILMPEGILWQDDKAFTGSMEDSSGTTKFNAETGLMWKEYAD